jgi:hypothetical protein
MKVANYFSSNKNRNRRSLDQESGKGIMNSHLRVKNLVTGQIALPFGEGTAGSTRRKIQLSTRRTLIVYGICCSRCQGFPFECQASTRSNRPGTHMFAIRNNVSCGNSLDQNILGIFDFSRNGLNRRPESTVSPYCANKARSRDSMMIHEINRVLPVVPCILVIRTDPGRSSETDHLIDFKPEEERNVAKSWTRLMTLSV